MSQYELTDIIKVLELSGTEKLNSHLDIGWVLIGTSSHQGESVNILLNFREFLQASCEHSVQIVTAHRRYFLLASDARFA